MSRWLLSSSCAVLIFFGFALPAVGQDKGKKYALLVGVKEYDHAGLSILKHTENDVEELGKLLGGDFSEIVLLTSSRGKADANATPTAENIRKQLRRLSAQVKRHDLLLVGLAGHGLQIEVFDPLTKTEKDESFFCPADARPRPKESLDELKKTMIPLGELFRELDASGAGVRLMLVDACRNEVRDSRGRNMNVDNLPRPSRGTAVLFSCKSGERAFESDKLGKGHGVFFHHVIEGLSGKARNKRGEVTWNSLADHVVERVADEVPALIGDGAKQTPHEMRNLEGKPPSLLGQAKVLPPDSTPAPSLETKPGDPPTGPTEASERLARIRTIPWWVWVVSAVGGLFFGFFALLVYAVFPILWLGWDEHNQSPWPSLTVGVVLGIAWFAVGVWLLPTPNRFWLFGTLAAVVVTLVCWIASFLVMGKIPHEDKNPHRIALAVGAWIGVASFLATVYLFN